MYFEFLKGLAELAEHLNAAAKMGGGTFDGNGMPTPYLAGKVEVRLDGEVVGHFDFVDEWVQYEPLDNPKAGI